MKKLHLFGQKKLDFDTSFVKLNWKLSEVWSPKSDLHNVRKPERNQIITLLLDLIPVGETSCHILLITLN